MTKFVKEPHRLAVECLGNPESQSVACCKTTALKDHPLTPWPHYWSPKQTIGHELTHSVATSSLVWTMLPYELARDSGRRHLQWESTQATRHPGSGVKRTRACLSHRKKPRWASVEDLLLFFSLKRIAVIFISEVRERCQIPWSWWYKWLWVLESKSRSSERGVHTLHHWAISLWLPFLFLQPIKQCNLKNTRFSRASIPA